MQRVQRSLNLIATTLGIVQLHRDGIPASALCTSQACLRIHYDLHRLGVQGTSTSDQRDAVVPRRYVRAGVTTTAKSTEATTSTAVASTAGIRRHVAGRWQLLRDVWYRGSSASTATTGGSGRSAYRRKRFNALVPADRLDTRDVLCRRHVERANCAAVRRQDSN